MKALTSSVLDIAPVTRCNEHAGSGEIVFRRLLSRAAFSAPIDFVDYTVIPPGSTIGRHSHVGNEEMYFVVGGSPLVRVGGEAMRLAPGSLSVVRDGEWHELVNDTEDDVTILVVQVQVTA